MQPISHCILNLRHTCWAGVSKRAFEENAGLRDHWNVLSLSSDRRGDLYISTMEAKHVRCLTHASMITPHLHAAGPEAESGVELCSSGSFNSSWLCWTSSMPMAYLMTVK